MFSRIGDRTGHAPRRFGWVHWRNGNTLGQRDHQPADAKSLIEVVRENGVHSASSARQTARCLRQRGHRVVLRNDPTPGARQTHWGLSFAFDDKPAKKPDNAGLRIWHLNPRSLDRAVRHRHRQSKHTLNAAFWTWDLSAPPRQLLPILASMDAIFVPSTFAKEALLGLFETPVEVLTLPIVVPRTGLDMRARLGIPGEAFLVSSVLDLGSSFERQNPLGVIEAFHRAFPGDKNAKLVIKVVGRGGIPNELTSLYRAAAYNPSVLISNHSWKPEQLHGLLRGSDAYISLHRSTCFGFDIARAALHGTPLIVTNWSGNMDYCSSKGVFLVDSKMVPVRDTHPEMRGVVGAVWANPNLVTAVEHLRCIRADTRAARFDARNVANVVKGHLRGNAAEEALDRLARRRFDSTQQPIARVTA